MLYCGFVDAETSENTIFTVVHKNEKGHLYVKRCRIEKYILIDDARYVLSPYQGERYCEIKELFNLLPRENYSVIINDVVISVPAKAKGIVEEYCAKHTESTHRKIKSKRVRAFVKKIVGDL